MSENYIKQNFADIQEYANVIEQRLDDTACTKEAVLEDNFRQLAMCKAYNCPYILIDKHYQTQELLL